MERVNRSAFDVVKTTHQQAARVDCCSKLCSTFYALCATHVLHNAKFLLVDIQMLLNLSSSQCFAVNSRRGTDRDIDQCQDETVDLSNRLLWTDGFCVVSD